MRILRLMFIATFLFSAPLVQAGQRIDITSCGQTLPKRARGTLQADLVCSSSEDGVRMGDRTTLLMNGHSITGAFTGIQVTADSRRVRIKGPGTISGNGAGIVADPDQPDRFRMVITDVSVNENVFGISARSAHATCASDTSALSAYLIRITPI